MRARLAILIVNFRTPTVTLDCLRSLEPEVAANPGTRVVVLDNGSGDDSVERIREGIAAQGWGSWCDLVAESNNWGFLCWFIRGPTIPVSSML